MGESESKTEEIGKPSRLLDKKYFVKDKSGIDHSGNTLSPKDHVRIFEVLAHRYHAAVSDFITNDNTSFGDIDEEGTTALHVAVIMACQKDNKDDSLYQCIDQLMSCDQMKVNMPNKKGYSAIGLALHYSHEKCVERILKHPSADRLHLDYYPGDSESTVREIIIEKYPDLEQLLPKRLKESLDSSDSDKKPLDTLQRDRKFKVWEIIMEKCPILRSLLRELLKEGNNSPSGDKKLLAALQHDNFQVFRKFLNTTHPNLWYDEPYYSTLLEISCHTENRQQFVKLLLEKDVDPNIKNRVTGMALIHTTARSGNLDVLKLLLKQEKINARVTDNKKRTVLHWLVRVSGKDPGEDSSLDRCFELVLNSCENQIIDWKDHEGNTALYVAVKRGFKDRVLFLLKRGADITLSNHGTPILSSSMVKEILDYCLECNDKPETSEDLKMTFNYEVLYKIIPRMAECTDQREVLKHPVTSCFINLHYPYIALCIMTSIIFLLTQLFILMFTNLYPGFIRLIMVIITWVASEINVVVVHRVLNNMKYLRFWENFLSLPIFIQTFGSEIDNVKNSWIWPYMLAISSLLVFLRLVLMTGRLPLVAVRMEMFKRMRLPYITCYVYLLIISGLVIYVNYKGSSKEDNDGVLAMLAHLLTEIAESLNINNVSWPSKINNLLSFLVVPLISLLLILLNSLLRFDTDELRSDAETLVFVQSVRVLINSDIYRISQNVFGSKAMNKGKVDVNPNRWKTRFPHQIFIFTDNPCFSRCIENSQKRTTEEK